MSSRRRTMNIIMFVIVLSLTAAVLISKVYLVPAAAPSLVVFTVTYYDRVDDVRCRVAVATLQAMHRAGFPMVVVDASPDPAVRKALAATGAIVSKQTVQGGKGDALREAATLASQQPNVTPQTWLCWQEPEKSDMASHWASALADAAQAAVMVPYREPSSFMATYPREQFHSESYGNLYLDAVATAAHAQLPPLDWHFGPVAFRARHLGLWTEYKGHSYDVQLAPMIHAARKHLPVASVPVPFIASPRMKAQEEGNVKFIEKRLRQLRDFDPIMKRELELAPA